LTTTLTWISWYQNVSISDFIGANGDEGGGNNWNYIIHAKFQSKCHHQQTNTQFFTAGCPSCCPTNGVKALKGKVKNI